MAHRAGSETEDDRLSAPDDEALTWLSGQVAAQAGERGLTIATAESCTGGLLGHSLTSIPGSSAFYLGGVIAYADAVKIAHLGVPAATIERHGAVSAQVAVAMAVGIRRSMGSDVGVSVTGIAGPDGGTDAKPVGLTYVAVAGIDGDEVRRHVWTGDRRSNKARGAAAALGLLGATLAASSDPEPDP